MDIQRINLHTSAFNEITHYIESDNGKEKVEVWFARELQSVLGYARWENFTIAIGRAVESCKSQKINVNDHFREVTKMVALGSGSKREVKDYMLTRFACYLIAQNGDPKKEDIAFAQGYFALQTRRAELIAEHLLQVSRLETRDRLRASEKQLSRNIYERGVDDRGFGRIRSKGDTALFGGHTTEDMKHRLGIKFDILYFLIEIHYLVVSLSAIARVGFMLFHRVVNISDKTTWSKVYLRIYNFYDIVFPVGHPLDSPVFMLVVHLAIEIRIKRFDVLKYIFARFYEIISIHKRLLFS